MADFGVSAPLESTRSAGIGLARTIAFWPPESASQGVLQADGVRRPPVEGWRASQAGDVWALAVSAHRMLTGRHITAGTTPEQQYELVCLGKYAVDGRLGAGWRRLLEDCLAHEPSRRRVSTAAELRRRLAELAVPPGYAGAPWPPGAPRLAALLDLDPAAGGPLLALTLDRPGGRVAGELLPAGGVLPAVARHLAEDVLPALAAPSSPPPATATLAAAMAGATLAFGGAGPSLRSAAGSVAGRGGTPAGSSGAGPRRRVTSRIVRCRARRRRSRAGRPVRDPPPCRAARAARCTAAARPMAVTRRVPAVRPVAGSVPARSVVPPGRTRPTPWW